MDTLFDDGTFETLYFKSLQWMTGNDWQQKGKDECLNHEKSRNASI